MNPKIAVITPYYKESLEVLFQCYESVLKQGIAVDHFFIADGFPLAEVASWKVQHIILPRAHGDDGNTPRAVGSLLAETEGYDFISYLDADNWFHEHHLSTLLSLWEQTKASVCCSWRTMHELDGTLLNITESDERSFEHVDTSCFLLHRSAFDCISVWHRSPKILSPVCDRVFFKAIKSKRHTLAFSQLATVAYRTPYAVHYQAAGRPVPLNAKTPDKYRAITDYIYSQAGIDEMISLLGFWYH